LSFAVPRSFKLLDELEKSEKGNLASQAVSYGLADQEDIFMHRWNGTLIMDDNILSLDIVCADEYPAMPPKARFSPAINWDGADADGTVCLAVCSCAKSVTQERVSAPYNLLCKVSPGWRHIARGATTHGKRLLCARTPLPIYREAPPPHFSHFQHPPCQPRAAFTSSLEALVEKCSTH
jgi:ubiquitin-conjugating enzyme E2 variant